MKTRIYILANGIFVIICVIIIRLWYIKANVDLGTIKMNLIMDDITFGMPEEEVIQKWGPGEFFHGMGGHGRNYLDKKIRVSFLTILTMIFMVKLDQYSKELFVNGEYSIAIRGYDKIEEIQIWFTDRDLQNRHY